MTTKAQSDTIRILTEPNKSKSDAALPSLAGKVIAEAVEVDSITFSDNLKSFISKIQLVLEPVSQTEGSYMIDEIELSLAINASGAIELIGKLSVGAEAGIKIKLKRK